MDLSLATTNELTEELLKRVDHGIFVGLRAGYKGDVSQYIRSWKGNTHTCVGLAQDLIFIMLSIFHQESHKEPGDDATEKTD